MSYNPIRSFGKLLKGDIMTQNIFFENLKKFRLAKKMTQEQAAERLGVNAQTVSRWECGTTLPDALMLPEIARLYGVTVDDFYKKNSVGYENYAQRLSSVYENSRDPVDFMRCREEFQKLIQKGEMSICDKWQYGWIHMFMMNYCRDVALEWYQKAVDDDPETNPHEYHIACMQRIWMYFLLKRGDEIIAECKEKVRNAPNDSIQTDNLLIALIYAEKFEEAYGIFSSAKEKFSDNWHLFIHGGEICEDLGRYDEAEVYFKRAGEIGTYFCDDLDCLANLYKKTGEYEKARECYLKMAETYSARGFDVEAERMKRFAEEVTEQKH